MNKEIYDEWIGQAAIREKDEVDALRKVLDPKDKRGVKNSYIDQYLKYYLLEYLSPSKTDTILEIGSGIGRLTEYLARFARSVYGIDIINKFIDDCRKNPAKKDNTFYLYIDEIDKLQDLMIDKIYIVWVLMCLTDREELIKTLKTYRDNLPNLKSGIIIEQVKSSFQLEHHNGRLHCCYRTIDEYIDIFTAAGFKVKKYYIMGERHYGIVYKMIHITRDFLPRKLAMFTDKLFYIDKYIMGDNTGKTRLINERRPTDVAFQLEFS
ncbi:MAG: hypothetical protein AMJ61_10815 [Desulfobacterales bacterium SG8_35_2]|nr:MAG: hypothetical protein AMJ61_10815 [Desulfobacterales bacterium SG8_35_2]